jgi:hypothetical protein
MLRSNVAGISVFAVCLVTLVAQVQAAPVHDWKLISKALGGVWTQAGMPVLSRLDQCKIKPQKETSTIDVLAADNPDFGAKKGDSIVTLKLDFPPLPPAANGKTYPPMTGISAVWVIGPNKIVPVSQWANTLQAQPVPLAARYGLKC